MSNGQYTGGLEPEFDAIILFKFDKNNFEISVVKSTDFLCIQMKRCFSEKK